MFRRLISRRTRKWTGTVACVLAAAVFVASRYYLAYAHFGVGTHGFECGVEKGFAWATDFDTVNGAEEWEYDYWLEPGFHANPNPRIDWYRMPLSAFRQRKGLRWGFNVSLWLPFVLLAIPTAWLWRLDRRRPLPGHCRKCNYNLTGNTSGRCPECGAEILKHEPTSASEPAGGNATGV